MTSSVTWKRRLKRVLQHAASRVGPPNGIRFSPRLLILTYHRVLPPSHEDIKFTQPGMVVSPETLRMHFRVLKKRFVLVDLANWVGKKRNGSKLPAMACAITFDDGWRDNFEHAWPVIEEEGVPCTIFVVSDFIGGNGTLWSNRLGRMMAATGYRLKPSVWNEREFRWTQDLAVTNLADDFPPTREEIAAFVQKAKNLSDVEIERRLKKMEDRLGDIVNGDDRDFMSWEEVEVMRKGGLVAIGSHTRRHTRLTGQVDWETMKSEVQESAQVISTRLGEPVRLFCYPNGDMTQSTVELVRKWYSGACSTEHKWNSQRSNLYRLGRIGVHEDISWDQTAFLATISGLL